MAKLDRLGWAAGFAFLAHGVHVGVRVNRADVLETLKEFLPEGCKPSRKKVVEQLYSLKVADVGARLRQFNLLYGNVNKLARTMNLADVFAALQKDLHHAVAFLATQNVFIRAGVVGWQGRAIILAGLEASGKTTLVNELVKAGATYYSDDYARLDSRGRVHPYAGFAHDFAVEQVGKSALPVATILVTRYQEGAPFRPRKLSAGQAALELLAHSSATRRSPQTALPFVQQAVSQAQAFKGVRGEASELVDYLLNNQNE
ncbi:MAG: hypothetical protein HY231_05240 [Acidobacteria bacterium]|nr:hypothetical protein [Acidobacteriota bacterium]